MRSTDEILRERLGTLADSAGPLVLDTGGVLRRIRKRRRLTTGGWAAGATVLVLLAGLGAVRLVPAPGAPRAGTPSSASAERSRLRPDLDPELRGFTCGDPFQAVPATDTAQVTATFDGLTAPDVGTFPSAQLTLTSPRDVLLWGGRFDATELLFLDEQGVIVGGGPFLRQPGDTSAHTDDLMPYAVELKANQPTGVDIEPGQQLCPGLTWTKLWADAKRYTVVVLFGRTANPHVDKDIGRLILDIEPVWPGHPAIMFTVLLSSARPGG